MPGTWFGVPDVPIQNPVGKTGMTAGVLSLVGSIVNAIENDPSPLTIAWGVVSVLGILFGDRVRRQKPPVQR